MHPAPSVIVFTVLSGLGFGFLAALGLGVIQPFGGAAFLLWGLGYVLATAGLLASTFHLGQPRRAWRAFSQWKTSWLSREAWASVAALLLSAPLALAAIAGGGLPPVFGIVAGLCCLLTVFCTAMIYAALQTVPRWNHWTTPALFMAFALAGGTLLSGLVAAAALLCAGLAVLQVIAFVTGDGRFAARGATIGGATGLGSLGAVRQFAPAHTGSNYLLREMIFSVARKHSRRLRIVAVLCAAILPALILLALPPGIVAIALATATHLLGAFASRWLFFAEAEHVVGLYYGRH